MDRKYAFFSQARTWNYVKKKIIQNRMWTCHCFVFTLMHPWFFLITVNTLFNSLNGHLWRLRLKHGSHFIVSSLGTSRTWQDSDSSRYQYNKAIYNITTNSHNWLFSSLMTRTDRERQFVWRQTKYWGASLSLKPYSTRFSQIFRPAFISLTKN